MKAKNIPNILSVLRLMMAFAFAAIFIWGYPDYVPAAIVLFVLSGVTDVLDGILARRFGWITNAGKILDPLADKLMQITAMLCLVLRGLLPWWILVFVMGKEALMGIGSIVFFRRSRQIGVSRGYGKAYTVLFFAVVVALLLFSEWFDAHLWAETAVCIALIAVAFSVLILYYIGYMSSRAKRKAAMQAKVSRKEA